ncbi:MAG: YqaJ viral recombinase family protein [Alphaproteobacteria bacterium]|nr:YqaJ viral recombinase family protein [Alphaproteobacteria bacterium]
MQPGSPEWHAERRKGLGGSDQKLLDEGRYQELWEIKTGRREPENLDHILPVRMGSFTEPFNIEWFMQETGYEVITDPTQTQNFAHHDYPFLRANLDGIVVAEARGPIECKHVNQFSDMGKVFETYYGQCQHQLLVSGYGQCWLSVFFGTLEWKHTIVPANIDYQLSLIDRAAWFWDFVERDVPPNGAAPETTEAAKEAREEALREVDMTGSNEWGSHAAAWLDARIKAADLKKTTDEAADGLKKLIPSDAKKAYGYGVQVVRAKTGTLSLKDHKASAPKEASDGDSKD